jgi:hypothetical protein
MDLQLCFFIEVLREFTLNLDDEEEMEERGNTTRNTDHDEVKSWDTETGLGAAGGGGEWVEDMDTWGGAGDALPGGFGEGGGRERGARARNVYRRKKDLEHARKKRVSNQMRPRNDGDLPRATHIACAPTTSSDRIVRRPPLKGPLDPDRLADEDSSTAETRTHSSDVERAADEDGPQHKKKKSGDDDDDKSPDADRDDIDVEVPGGDGGEPKKKTKKRIRRANKGKGRLTRK